MKSVLIGFGILAAAFTTHVLAAEILVPEDQPTIQACVDAAVAGDTCSIAPGTYFETPLKGPFADYMVNVDVNKAITIKARELYQTIVDGGGNSAAVFIIRAEAHIEGLVIQNSYSGVVQRDSLDVGWTAENLIIRNMTGYGLGVDDKFSRAGSAEVWNIVVDNSDVGYYTNDAVSLDVTNSVATNCRVGLQGHNHSSFAATYYVSFDNTKVREVYLNAVDLPAVGAGFQTDDPLFTTVTTTDHYLPYFLSCTSPAVDAGDPNPQFDDVSSPPSLGNFRNDIGGYGGPGASLDLADEDKISMLKQAGCPVDEDGDGVLNVDDCDDLDASVFPGAPELCDDKDNDCDGLVPTDEADNDGDGFRGCDNDCDDADPDISPGADEIIFNFVDENCDGNLGECDPCSTWSNHGQYVRCVAQTVSDCSANNFTPEEANGLVNSAARSDIGKQNFVPPECE